MRSVSAADAAPRIAARPPRYVAYVYPGWHPSSYRPGIDEWRLLHTFEPYFPGHLPPPKPIHGPYDDSHPETAAAQIALARSMGIEAFTYFMYYSPHGLVMAEPMTRALEASASLDGAFGIGGTLCLRLPHDRFPVPARDELEPPPPPPAAEGTSLDDTPIERLTLRDLAKLVGEDAAVWSELTLTGHVGRPSANAPLQADGPDSGTGRNA
jgi:hypothetical protein